MVEINDFINTQGVISNEDFHQSAFNSLPVLDIPIDAAGLDYHVDQQQLDPEINYMTGLSRNAGLEALRNRNPFVEIDPPTITVTGYRLAVGAPELVVSVPQEACMYRVTVAGISTGTVMAMSNTRGIVLSVTVTAQDGVLILPTSGVKYRYCKGGGGEIVLKNIGGSSAFVSIEFFEQL